MLRKAMLLAVIGSAVVASSAYAGQPHVKVFSGGGGHYPTVHQPGAVVRAAPYQASNSGVMPRAKLTVRKSGSENRPYY